MKIEDFESTCEIKRLNDIEVNMAKRFEAGSNLFTITLAGSEFPMVLCLVIHDLAHITYFPQDGHPGFVSLAEPCPKDPNSSVIFHLTKQLEPQEILNQFVVDYKSALNAVKEFYSTHAIPKCIQWFEL